LELREIEAEILSYSRHSRGSNFDRGIAALGNPAAESSVFAPIEDDFARVA
jgi:hypothetical protein